MKKVLNIALASVLFLSLTGCDEFLNRPTIDNYSVGTYYKNDDQCIKGVNYLYSSPWYDFQRAFTNVGETMSGNMANSGSVYVNLTISPDHEELTNMSKSLWSVICHCSTVADNIYNAEGPSTAIKHQTIGETMVWKAMAYFYLVRYYGEVPIIHNNAEKMNEGGYNVMPRNTKENVFEYILMTLEAAEKLLPKNPVSNGRIDYWSARALEAKVYLAYAGVSGTLDNEKLKKAAEISKDVIENSGRALLPVYSDNFRLEYNINNESLISWQWNGNVTQWTCQNSFQCDNAMQHFGDGADNWGHWRGASVDLQEAFGIPATMDPAERKLKDVDARRKATYMLPGDTYEYFWRDVAGGFDPLRCCYDAAYARYGCPNSWGGGAGSHLVKHLFGTSADHAAVLGYAPSRNMSSGLATHLLRLSDVMLINAEANVLLDGEGNIADGAKYLNAVRKRSIAGYVDVNGYTFEDIWKERRKELAFEGDRWLDFVRVSWYNPEFAVNELKNQKRAEWYGFENCYKYYFDNGTWDLNAGGDPDSNGSTTMPKFRYPTPGFDNGVTHPEAYQNGITAATFKLQLPPDDIIFNEHLDANKYPAENMDPRTAFNYEKYINL